MVFLESDYLQDVQLMNNPSISLALEGHNIRSLDQETCFFQCKYYPIRANVAA